MKKLLAIGMVVAMMSAAGTAMAATSTADLSVTATMTATCSISTPAAMNFTLNATSTNDATATSSVDIWCTKGTSGTLTFGTGLNPSGGENYMHSTSANDSIRYSLAPTTASDANYTGQGKNNGKTIELTGTVANADYVNAAAADDYEDTVVLTVTY
jgi:spore coat protein U-like protein